MKKKLLLAMVVVLGVLTVPRLIYNFQKYSLKARESAPKVQLKKLLELEQNYHKIHGIYSYDLEQLGYLGTPETQPSSSREVIIGFSRPCATKVAPATKLLRSYDSTPLEQRWTRQESCGDRILIKDDLKLQSVLDAFFESEITCKDPRSGFEVTALISSCGSYGIYRMAEDGVFRVIKPIVDPFSYSKFFN